MMDIYNRIAQKTSKDITTSYSTSFSFACLLFNADIRPDIYNIYGLVRVADEIVDTYTGDNKLELLNGLEADVYQAYKTGYSANLVVQAFTLSARKYGITQDLVKSFFDSMRKDIDSVNFDSIELTQYIYGSAEVIGLMCLRVFCYGDSVKYDSFIEGAKSLGSAFQKVNFLRDFRQDNIDLGRSYFPGLTINHLDETSKTAIIRDINHDFERALIDIYKLPISSRAAVITSYRYYGLLLKQLEQAQASEIINSRIRVNNFKKLTILCRGLILKVQNGVIHG